MGLHMCGPGRSSPSSFCARELDAPDGWSGGAAIKEFRGLANYANSPDGEKRRLLCSGYRVMCWFWQD
jgi:hypothetical protein